MKLKNYEKKTGIIIFYIIAIILEIIALSYLINTKMYIYKKISTIYVDKKTIETFVNVEERKVLYKNIYLYIDDKKIKYEIIKDNGNTLNDGNKKYYELYLKINTKEKYKINDNITISVQDKKISMLEMFKLIWGGDKNNKT